MNNSDAVTGQAVGYDREAGLTDFGELKVGNGEASDSQGCQKETDLVARDLADPVNVGLPKLDLQNKPVSYFEFWPAWFFYIPVVVYWLMLSIKYRSFGLPMAVNQHIFLGGMVGESKSQILNMAGDKAKALILPFLRKTMPALVALQNRDEILTIHINNVLIEAKAKGIVFPLVVKPDLGCRGNGVKLVANKQELHKYLSGFPEKRQYMLQKLAPYSAEAGVFYERVPGQNTGHITSLTLKYRPYVRGDGKRTLAQLIADDSRAKHLEKLYFANNYNTLNDVPDKHTNVAIAFAGSHCRGSIFRNGEKFITPGMVLAIDQIMQDFPDFYYGRLDVKFKNMESFQQGKDFLIIELNGASSEATHIWDSRTELKEVFAVLFGQYRRLFFMGDKLRQQGVKIPSALRLIKVWLRELSQSKAYPVEK